ncbi:hypothetical protein OAory_01101220 [Aspergillus oryzae]|uniref:Vacuolar ATPase assembly protein VMA22 n=1 Tax=Aspergillus oryzae TaxID=5062 RepID=A0A1S9DIQ6_ASPOZ|nr:uncharacterized protein G4B84_009488 [Aspergillus flavus NRRL3357]OOO08826.1 hypothetical protein OAory_01101220 [Aspergillus oryzae]QMW34022.1 hypothetical protein G4B84_009488 [Aspergillus flavus NRRL3357]QMW46076.1 hypothetical protein G4B11_009531 [Aspergillus flavus]
MAQIPTPPASRHGSESPGIEYKQPPVVDPSDLLQSLDTLLERYLHLLDRHQKLQAELATTLSSGFLSLAQANYTCPPGRRYGADYYDERMKATRKVASNANERGVIRDLEPPTSTKNVEASSVDESSDESTKRGDYKRIFTIKPATSDSAEEPSELTKGENQSHSSDAFTSECEVPEECDPKAEDSTTSSGNPGAQEPTETKPRSSEKTLRSSDPIRWYGILVSPFLRSAQKSFTEAVGGPLPELASVVVEMQAVEKEVKSVRKKIDQA